MKAEYVRIADAKHKSPKQKNPSRNREGFSCQCPRGDLNPTLDICLDLVLRTPGIWSSLPVVNTTGEGQATWQLTSD